MPDEETHEIVIIGGGICGLATALALHRKGIKSLVLERSDEVRTIGGAISIYLNGWHALDQLGVGDDLRSKAIQITEIKKAWLDKGKTKVIPCRKAGLRCVKRSDLVEAMAANLPPDSIRFGCRIVATEVDPVTSFRLLQASDGSIIKAKVLIGCDGSNSIVAKRLGLKAPETFNVGEALGFTNYPTGHGFGDQFLHLYGSDFFLGRIPVSDKLIFWFVDHEIDQRDIEAREDPKLIRDLTLDRLRGSPEEVIDMMKNSMVESVTLTRIRFRPPWHVLFGRRREGTTTVAGDALHVIDPSIGQGGSAAMEDAVVLARCLARELCPPGGRDMADREMRERAETALARYVGERLPRIMRLSTQAFLLAAVVACSSPVKKMVVRFLLVLISGSDPLGHIQFDCGHI